MRRALALLLACAPSEPVPEDPQHGPPDSPIEPVPEDMQTVPEDIFTEPVPRDSPPAPPTTRPPPPGFVDLRAALPDACFDPTSHTARATGPARAHRARLLQVMRAAGFRDYPLEWWHFHFPLENTRPLDIPYGLADPDLEVR